MDIPFGRTDFPLDAKTETVLHFAKVYCSKLDCKAAWHSGFCFKLSNTKSNSILFLTKQTAHFTVEIIPV